MATLELRVVREKERFRLTGLSRCQAWRLERAGQFPSRIHLGANSVGWLASEIEQWILSRAAQR